MRRYIHMAALGGTLILVACGGKPEVPEAQPLPAAVTRPVSYQSDIRPILETKCLACHGCFDAACQLKMESLAGLIRGAHPLDAYDGSRTEAQWPMRLGIDAEDEAGWRDLGFRSVLDRGEQPQALLYNMLALGKQHPFPPHSRLPDDIELGVTRGNQCVANEDFADYARKHPLEGMPLGVTGLSDGEFALLRGWFDQGAPVEEAPQPLRTDEQAAIDRWEALLNRPGKREQLVARWLYEHLFLAHLHFADLDGTPRFFELLRSQTPPGAPIKPVTTPRPNDPPPGTVHYRLRPVDGAIVHKRHITFALDAAQMQRIDTLFFSDDWPLETLPGYSYAERANPFHTFAAIPARARYQFMLDHAEYFTRTFIRGPVCRGQIATDVIRDHFWAVFQAPAHDLFVTDRDHHDRAVPLLAMPGQDDDLLAAGDNWSRYRDQRNRYQVLRDDAYRAQHPEGASLDTVWDGDGHNTNAVLTIVRHHDSASVERGLIGRVPQTIWWMDYPLFERTYYELVVNFDVFGNVAHQLQTRLYFDLIRNGSEYNFLRLLPPEARQATRDDWYRGLGKLKTHVTYAPLDTRAASAESYASDAPKQELALRLLQRFAAINVMAEDRLNRCSGDACGRRDQPRWIRDSDRHLARLTAVPAAQLPGIEYLPEVTFVRVRNDDGERTVYTLLRNRAHSNVAFLTGEALRYEPEKDELLIYPGIIGSYPNFIFDVPATDLDAFSRRLGAASTAATFDALVQSWGVRRTHPGFWAILHDFTAWQRQHQPLQAGVFDINRYENL